MKYASVESSPMRPDPINNTNKKLFHFGYHDNSDDLKTWVHSIEKEDKSNSILKNIKDHLD